MSRPRITWDPDSIYILPTRFGAGFLLLSLLTLVGCVNYLLSLGYALTFLLLSVWIVCAAHASRALGGVRVSVRPPDRAFVDTGAAYAVTLHNDAVRPHPAVTLRARGVDGADTRLTLDLPAGTGAAAGEVGGQLTRPTRRRGLLAPGGWRLEGRDPLGLWRSHRVLRPADVAALGVLVAPAPEPGAPPPPAPQRGGEQQDGLLRARGDEDDNGLREYRPGDPPRRVAWKQAARAGTLLTREFDAPAARRLDLRWDAAQQYGAQQHGGPYPGGSSPDDTEARLSRLTAWVLSAHQDGARYALELPGNRLESGQGEGQLLRALELLATHGLSGAGAEGQRARR